MDICYNKLFKMLIDKGMKKTEFRKQVGVSVRVRLQSCHVMKMYQWM